MRLIFKLQGTLSYPAPAKKEDDEEEKPGDRFEGSLAHGQREGKGKYVWSSGCYYEGSYKDHMRHGQGVLTFPDKGRYEGQFSQVVPSLLAVSNGATAQRHQTLTLATPTAGHLDMLASKLMLLSLSYPHAEGLVQALVKSRPLHLDMLLTLYKVMAAGDWSENKMHGQGFYIYANGDMYTGTFDHGIKNGQGSYYFKVRPAMITFCICLSCRTPVLNCSVHLSPKTPLQSMTSLVWPAVATIDVRYHCN